MSSSNSTRRAGFTLMEMCVMLVIIGIVGAMVLAMAGNQGLGPEAAARMLAADLRYAQTHAVTYRQSVKVVFDDANSAYSILDSSDQLLINPVNKKDYRVVLDAGNGFAGLVTVNDFTDSTLTFSATGVPDAGGSVQMAVGSETRTVTVRDVTGNVYITDP